MMRQEQQEQREVSRYPGLSIISQTLKVFAWVFGVIGIAYAIASPFYVSGTFFSELSLVVGILVVTALQAIILYAIGDYLKVVMDVEYNTNQTNQMLQRTGIPPQERRIA